MSKLFDILDGINSSEHADQTLASLDGIVLYAEACGEDIDYAQAKRIQAAGVAWRAGQQGRGDWSALRHETMAALED